MPTLTVDDGHHLARFIAARLEDLRTQARTQLTGDVATTLRVEIAARAALTLAAHADLRTPRRARRAHAIRTLQNLAAPYAWHPDHDPAWRPTWLDPAGVDAMRRAMHDPNAAQQLTHREHTNTAQKASHADQPHPDETAGHPGQHTLPGAPPGWESVTHALRKGANLWEPGRILAWLGNAPGLEPPALVEWPDRTTTVVPLSLLVSAPTPSPEPDEEPLVWDRDEDDEEPLVWVEVLTPDDTAAHAARADR